MPPCAYSVLLSLGFGLRDDDDVARSRQLNRRAEPGDAAADDYEVAAYIHRTYTRAVFSSQLTVISSSTTTNLLITED